jgi:hypothetical protein
MTFEAIPPAPSPAPVAAFDLALPRKRMASTVLLFDESDRVLGVTGAVTFECGWRGCYGSSAVAGSGCDNGSRSPCGAADT